MSVELGAGLFAWARTVDLLMNMIGQGENIRFFPIAVQEQQPLPYVVYEEEKDAEASRHEAPAVAATSMVTFYCAAANPDDAALLHSYIYDALIVPRFRGMMGPVTVQAVLYESSTPAYQGEEQEYVVEGKYKFCYNLS